MPTGTKKITKKSPKISKRARTAFVEALRIGTPAAKEAVEEKFPEFVKIHQRLGKGWNDLAAIAKHTPKSGCNCPEEG